MILIMKFNVLYKVLFIFLCQSHLGSKHYYDLGCGYFLIDKLLFQGGLTSVGSHSHSPLVFHIGLEKQKQEVNRKIILGLW